MLVSPISLKNPLSNMIKAVNFSISNLCFADCIYCPKDRGECCSVRLMSLDTFESIVINLISREFLVNNRLKVIRLGENGDLFLNENAVGMLRIIRKKFPYTVIELYNHFYMMKPSISDALLKEKLIDCIFTNIDGVDENYKKVKNVDFDTTIENLSYFIKKRDDAGISIPVIVRALTLKNYIDVVKANFNALPAYVSKEMSNIPDDFQLINQELNKVLNKKMDRLTKGWVCMWGEREHLGGKNRNGYSCPMLFRNDREIYIAPDGKWYLCCMDSKQELIVGDLTKDSVQELVMSKKRNQMLKMLKSRNFTGIGGPCRTVECCHVYSANPLISRLIRMIMNRSISQKILGLTFFHNLIRKK